MIDVRAIVKNYAQRVQLPAPKLTVGVVQSYYSSGTKGLSMKFEDENLVAPVPVTPVERVVCDLVNHARMGGLHDLCWETGRVKWDPTVFTRDSAICYLYNVVYDDIINALSDKETKEWYCHYRYVPPQDIATSAEMLNTIVTAWEWYDADRPNRVRQFAAMLQAIRTKNLAKHPQPEPKQRGKRRRRW